MLSKGELECSICAGTVSSRSNNNLGIDQDQPMPDAMIVAYKPSSKVAMLFKNLLSYNQNSTDLPIKRWYSLPPSCPILADLILASSSLTGPRCSTSSVRHWTPVTSAFSAWTERCLRHRDIGLLRNSARILGAQSFLQLSAVPELGESPLTRFAHCGLIANDQ